MNLMVWIPLYASADYQQFDLAFRARLLGLQTVYEPRSRVVHTGGASNEAACPDEPSSSDRTSFCARFDGLLPQCPQDTRDEFELRAMSAEGPVLLVVEFGVPQPDRHAGDVTMSKYLEILATAGWRVVFAAMDERADGPAAEALEREGIELIRRLNTLEDWLSENGRHVSAVWLSRPDVAEVLIAKIRSHTKAYIAYYTHDLHHVRLQQEADLRGGDDRFKEAARVKAQECAIFQSVDHVMSPSVEEAVVIRHLAPGIPVTVLPPYYYESSQIRFWNADHFEPLSDIVFVGGFPHVPNVDAALFIATSIMPIVWDERPDARLVLIGYAPPPEVLALAGPRIVVTGQVPDIGPFLDKARLLLGALRYGAGVKGKTVDALRYGLPTVLTPIAAEGIGIEPGREAIVAQDAAGLAKGVLELLKDFDRCAAMSAAGAELIRRRFSRSAARASVSAVFRTPRCEICGSGKIMAPPPDGNVRETIICGSCFALGRSEALARVVLARLARDGEDSLAELARRKPECRVHEFGRARGIADTLRGQPWFSVSDFLADVPPGRKGPGKIPREVLTSQTNSDTGLDLVISQDVMEHLADPVIAFAEIAGLLRTGGPYIFTTRQNLGEAKSGGPEEADIHQGMAKCYPPPEGFGAPTVDCGALVLTEVRTDAGAMLEAVGLHLIEHDVPVLGGAARQSVRVFEAVKAPVTASV